MMGLEALAAIVAIGTSLQKDAHEPHPWRSLTAAEQSLFDLGYAVFNTEWVPANSPSGRIDGLGPLFNSQGCDACHNSRRRGRGPRQDGEAPSDLVIQLGHVAPTTALAPGHAATSIVRGSADYGFVLSTSAIRGFTPEGRAVIEYQQRRVTLGDGTAVDLRQPTYRIDHLSGPALPPDTLLMPRMPPSVQGVGLLEQVRQSELQQIARSQRESTADIRGQVPAGRFGWQATEPTVASQTAVAFAREMGLTSSLVSASDCGSWNVACLSAASGGTPEVAPDLFEALVAFERWHAVPLESQTDQSSAGAQLLQTVGCADCHRMGLRVELQSKEPAEIHPYTDLLLHDMGVDLADRDLTGTAVPQRWRTAPLWGMHAAYVTGQPLRLLHDGRARSIEEAVMWHDGEARRARDRYASLSKQQRQQLLEWLASL